MWISGGINEKESNDLLCFVNMISSYVLSWEVYAEAGTIHKLWLCKTEYVLFKPYYYEWIISSYLVT